MLLKLISVPCLKEIQKKTPDRSPYSLKSPDGLMKVLEPLETWYVKMFTPSLWGTGGCVVLNKEGKVK